MNPSKKLRKLVAEGYQLTPEAFSFLNSLEDVDSVIDRILSSGTLKLILSIDDIKDIIEKEEDIEVTVEIDELDKEKTKIDEQEKKEVISPASASEEVENEVEIEERQLPTKEERQLPIKEEQKTSVRKEQVSSAESFRQYFKNRFEVINSYFSKRRDIKNRVLTSDLEPNKNRDNVSLVAIVTKIQNTRKGNIIIELEDLEGTVISLIHVSKPDLVQSSQFILEDSVLCFVGSWRNKLLNINEVLWPDIPYTHKPNYAYEEVLALHISDIHVGSKNFAGKLFHKAINLINGTLQDEKYNKVGEKIKYLFVAGDVVDGIGVYPGQKDDLMLDNIQLQYHLATEYFDQIRKDVEIVIIPGNHDGARSAEPQTPIQKEFAQNLFELDNVHLLGSPCYLKAHNVEIMLNHGNSILDINAAIPAIPHETSIPAMREMLKNRHLVPIYGKRTPIAPAPTDELIISRIPDIFHTGHTHIAGDDRYKGVLLLNSGTFQYQTSYQRSMNINPTTGLTYIVNLKNLERSKINFNEIN